MICRHCGRAITWDDWGFIHDDTGIADCVFLNASGRAVGHRGVYAEPTNLASALGGDPIDRG